MSGGGDRKPLRARLAALVEALGLEPSPPLPCPYLSGRESRLVVLRPQRLTPPLYGAFLDLNFRRLGDVVYRPRCEGCFECRQLRVDASAFRPNRAQRRCRTRNLDLRIEIQAPEPTAEKHTVYRRYLEARHDGQMSGSWQEFQELLHSVSFTEEVVFRQDRRLVGAGIFDAAPEALSAVYFYFDPAFARRSPGVFHVLWLIEECQRRGARWLYLGYHVPASPKMAYKAGFRPNQVLDDSGRWRRRVAALGDVGAALRAPLARAGHSPVESADMSLKAEPARPHDLRGALELLGRSQLTQQDVAERWGHYFVVREDDGRVVGVAGLEVHGEDGLLRSVAVDPDYRGQGLAASLVAAALERARRLELRAVYLLTTGARGYFSRRGFSACERGAAPVAIRESWEFRSGCPSTAALMKHPLA